MFQQVNVLLISIFNRIHCFTMVIIDTILPHHPLIHLFFKIHHDSISEIIGSVEILVEHRLNALVNRYHRFSMVIYSIMFSIETSMHRCMKQEKLIDIRSFHLCSEMIQFFK